MDKYAKEIDRLVRNNDGELIGNCSEKHAVVLLRKFFQNAENTVRVFSGELAFSAYNAPELIEEIHLFLESGKHLYVIVENEVDRNNPIWEISEAHPDGVTLMRLNSEALAKEPDFHFAIMDERGYRFEGDKRKPAAIAAFGDKPFTAKLRGAFESLESCSTLYTRSS